MQQYCHFWFGIRFRSTIKKYNSNQFDSSSTEIDSSSMFLTFLPVYFFAWLRLGSSSVIRMCYAVEYTCHICHTCSISDLIWLLSLLRWTYKNFHGSKEPLMFHERFHGGEVHISRIIRATSIEAFINFYAKQTYLNKGWFCSSEGWASFHRISLYGINPQFPYRPVPAWYLDPTVGPYHLATCPHSQSAEISLAPQVTLIPGTRSTHLIPWEHKNHGGSDNASAEASTLPWKYFLLEFYFHGSNTFTSMEMKTLPCR